MNVTNVKNQVPKHPTKSLTYRNVNNITHVVIHHGLTRRGLSGTNYLSYLDYHINNIGWNCGGYTFGINDNGEILQGYDLNVRTNHVGKFNSTHLGIVLAGDFRYEDPTDEQYQSLLWLLKEHLPKVLPNAFKIIGHQEVDGYEWKQCPAIDMDEVRTDVDNYGSDMKYAEANVIYNGEKVKGFIENGQTFVQIRDLANLMNVQIGYNSKTKEVTFNNKVVTGKVAQGRTYLHIREAANIVGLKVKWDQSTRTVTLK